MSFEISPVQGTVEELNVDLSVPSQHQREEFVIEEVKKAIDHIITSLGGYLSVSCSGNINPVSGETGDVINIYVTSLPAPASVAAETPNITVLTEEEVGKNEVEEVVPIETSVPVQQEQAPVEEPIVPPENTEIPTAPVPPATPEISSENPPATAPEANTTSIGQAEAQEVAQATPPVDA